MKWLMFILFLLPGVTLSDMYTINDLMARLNATLEDRDSLVTAFNKGKQRAELCQHCHGKNGNSLRDYIPNLAAQNPRYLLTQFEYFRLGKRKDYVMGNLAKSISEDDRINLAIYYSRQKVSTKATSTTVTSGKDVFNKRCVACHGQKGYGNKDLPRIAGQPDKYIAKTLTDYQNKTNRRPNSPMLGIAATLSTDEINVLAAYLSTLN